MRIFFNKICVFIGVVILTCGVGMAASQDNSDTENPYAPLKPHLAFINSQTPLLQQCIAEEEPLKCEDAFMAFKKKMSREEYRLTLMLLFKTCDFWPAGIKYEAEGFKW